MVWTISVIGSFCNAECLDGYRSFIQFHCTYIDPHRGYLTPEELNNLKSKKLNMPRLALVRDAFLFSCYTGLAFSDIEKLNKNNGNGNEATIG